MRPDQLFGLRGALTMVAALGAASVAAAAGAATAPVPPTASFTIDAGRLVSPLRPKISGTLDCTKNAHYHLNAWLADPDRGALAKGSIPPKFPANPTALVIARARAATLCTGATQPWSLTLRSVGKRPTGFGAGTVAACVILYSGKSHLYTLAQQCKDVTLP